MTPSRRRPAGAVALGCAVVVALLAMGITQHWSPLLRLDNWVGAPAQAVAMHYPRALTILLVIQTLFGTIGSMVYGAVLFALAWLHRRPRIAWWGLGVLVGTAATTTLLKVLVQRARPTWDHPVETLGSFSYPSGHASGIAAGMGVALVVSSLYAGRRRTLAPLSLVAMTVVVVVGADRILLGVHNLSDVIGGYAVGGVWLALMTLLLPPFHDRPAEP